MNINSLGGPRMNPLASTNSASSTARTSFDSLLQGAGAPKAGGAGQITGGNVISAAISVNVGSGSPAGVGAPYQQATPPTPAAGGAKPGSELNAELKAGADAEKMAMMKQLAVLSMTSFASSTFSLGQNGIKLETAD